MREVSRGMAEYLFNIGRPVYAVYEDGTETLIENIEQLVEHRNKYGLFGTEVKA